MGLRGLRPALAFLTPIGGSATPDRAALAWFGVVGAGIGAAVGTTWWAAGQVLPLGVAAALALAADAALTGMLHLDGLADTGDGLVPPLPAERRLEVMRDPRAGAFGVVTVTMTTLVRFAAFASFEPRVATVAAVAALWATARTAMAVAALTVPYARPSGLASAFVEGGPSWPVALVAGGVPALGLSLLGATPPARGLLAVAAAALGAAIVVTFARGRIGGFTGDVLGAAGVVAETAGLVLLTVRS